MDDLYRAHLARMYFSYCPELLTNLSSSVLLDPIEYLPEEFTWSVWIMFL
jgi:hypothetical protein